MADLIDRAALYDKLLYDTTRTIASGAEYLTVWRVADAIEDAPAVDAVEVKALRKQLNREHSRLYRVDEDFERRMGGYNPSSFTAGFYYALERMIGWVTTLEEERRTDA